MTEGEVQKGEILHVMDVFQRHVRSVAEVQVTHVQILLRINHFRTLICITFTNAPLITWTGHVTKPLIVFVRTVINSITHIVLVDTAAASFTPVITWTRHVVHGNVFVLSIAAVLFSVVQEKGGDAVAISTRVETLFASDNNNLQSRHTVAIQFHTPWIKRDK